MTLRNQMTPLGIVCDERSPPLFCHQPTAPIPMLIEYYLENHANANHHHQENNWGGGDSERKAALLEEGLMNLFKTKKEIYKDEVSKLTYICMYHASRRTPDATCLTPRAVVYFPGRSILLLPACVLETCFVEGDGRVPCALTWTSKAAFLQGLAPKYCCNSKCGRSRGMCL